MCYNELMVRQHTHKLNIFILLLILLASTISLDVFLNQWTSASTENTTFEVNVRETLAVSISTPVTWASGYANNFLRNAVTLSVSSNNAGGYTASMTTDKSSPILENTAVNSTSTINTISSSVAKSAFPSKGWGYSLEGKNSGDTTAGTDSGVYNPMVGLGASSPITVLSSNTKGSDSQNIFFGAKADYTVDSGTYIGTVVISVVSGVTAPTDPTNPVIPVDPATPNDPNGNDNPHYSGAGTTTGGSTNGTTTYTTVATTSTTRTTTTHVDEGDTRSSYTNPAGVTNVHEGTPLATGLAVTSAIAATSGIVFFIIAKRREDDEDEEEY